MTCVSELWLQTGAALPAGTVPGTGALRDRCSLGAEPGGLSGPAAGTGAGMLARPGQMLLCHHTW